MAQYSEWAALTCVYRPEPAAAAGPGRTRIAYGTTTCTSADVSPVPALFTARTRTK
jgi:hypothetical protein